MAEQAIYTNVTPTETEVTGERQPKSHRCPGHHFWNSSFTFGFLLLTYFVVFAFWLWHVIQIGTKNPDDELRLELNRSLETQQNVIQMLEDAKQRVACLRRAILVSDHTSKCLQGWTLVNQKCYFLSTDKKTREDSERFCAGNGAVLATVRSKDSILKCHIQSKNEEFWVGLQKRVTWTGDVAMTQWFWPDNTTELSLQNTQTTNCAKMGKTIALSPCSDLLPWICERKPDKSNLLEEANAC
ncbi:killer cell lectin-like receptor subfamily G member 1 [Rana temporaria]|uniref:killer cell lectin-like receptor subfamily G member 1 n=1 Tax=Rana temporaria TaxID=8407 RepID=UPI001AACB32F|nr:killer cell lectin-like receptor subfamily G member 1 [Rana temporaria]